ncbi:MAG: low molecular weight protein-tyrosine-phosphatase [Gammaproteobacteria bacterium]
MYASPVPATTRAPAAATPGKASGGGGALAVLFDARTVLPYNSVLSPRPAAPGRPLSVINSLLVVCTGNICRSPMAAALFKEHAYTRNHEIEVGSAGVAALVGSAPPEPVLALMQARGFDVSGHRARQLTGELGTRHDLLLVMEGEQQRYIERTWPFLKGRVHRLGKYQGADVLDPYGLPEKFYAQSLAQIEAYLGDWQERLFG